jgi:hypothetical protein
VNDTIEITLDLCGHCIETEIKRRYNRAVSEYFQTQSNRPFLEKQIEILKTVLERCDFRELRNAHPELAGYDVVNLILASDQKGRVTIVINDKTIALF